MPPRIDVFNEEVNLEDLGKRFRAEILRQETDMPKVIVGNTASLAGTNAFISVK